MPLCVNVDADRARTFRGNGRLAGGIPSRQNPESLIPFRKLIPFFNPPLVFSQGTTNDVCSGRFARAQKTGEVVDRDVGAGHTRGSYRGEHNIRERNKLESRKRRTSVREVSRVENVPRGAIEVDDLQDPRFGGTEHLKVICEMGSVAKTR